MVDELLGPLPADWAYTTLGEACADSGGGIQTGPFGSQLHASDYVSDGIPAIMPTNIGDNQVNEHGIARIAPQDVERLQRYRVRIGDIVYSRRGDVEKRALIRYREDGWLCGTGCLRVRFGAGNVDASYAAYYLGHGLVRDWITRHAHGATMPNLNTAILSALPLVIPPLEEQRAIARVLGALDDRIELNRRMSETLEEMARALFRSWFVDFDPVRAKAEGRPSGLPPDLDALFPASFEASELGEIPAGWEVREVAELCTRIENGGTPKRATPQYWGGSIDWFKTSELDDGPLLSSQEKITLEGLSESSCKLWDAGTVLIALYASPTVGRLGILEVPATSNQACCALLAKPEFGNLFLYYTLLSTRERLRNLAVGSAQQNISQRVVREHSVVAPTAVLATAFQDSVQDLYRSAAGGLRESTSLATLRDTLVPRLISGQLRVRTGT